MAYVVVISNLHLLGLALFGSGREAELQNLNRDNCLLILIQQRKNDGELEYRVQNSAN